MIGGVEKVATLMLMVTQDNASKIFGLLEEEEIKLISQAMSRLGLIPPDTIEQLISEFQNGMVDSASYLGNLQSTERFLRKILGKDKVEGILEDIRGPAGRNIWDKLSNVSDDVLANYIKSEYPQTAALILSKLNPQQAAGVLTQLNQEFAFEVMKRMIVMDNVKKEVLDRVEKTLRTEFIGSLGKSQKIDQNQVLAEIFNNFDRTHEAAFMTMLEKHDSSMAERIKSLMFTFDDLKRVNTIGIQAVLKAVDKSKLAIALKGASEEIRKLFMDNMSQRAAKILAEDMESMGPVKLRDVDSAQSEIINLTKSLIASGEAELSDSGDQMVY
ncbi:MAG: flagellar motor switch protein FliG [Proteobacteria bacterium]|nr:flagellar motor switch protein FliG [Pseudomonadota bacterium]